MRIIGHGVDLVDVQRITQMLERHAERFLERCFTDSERTYAQSSLKRRDEHLAARFAAKEAVLKALGTGWRDGIAWTDIEVIRHPSGQPTVMLHGEARNVAATLGITAWQLSISHTQTQAMASVIATGD